MTRAKHDRAQVVRLGNIVCNSLCCVGGISDQNVVNEPHSDELKRIIFLDEKELRDVQKLLESKGEKLVLTVLVPFGICIYNAKSSCEK